MCSHSAISIRKKRIINERKKQHLNQFLVDSMQFSFINNNNKNTFKNETNEEVKIKNYI